MSRGLSGGTKEPEEPGRAAHACASRSDALAFAVVPGADEATSLLAKNGESALAVSDGRDQLNLVAVAVKNGTTNGTTNTNGSKPYPAGFEKAWEDYPLKKDKGEAAKKWATVLRSGVSPEDLSRACANYVETWRQEHDGDLAYCKYLKTLLTDAWREYLDGPQVVRRRRNGKADPNANLAVHGNEDKVEIW